MRIRAILVLGIVLPLTSATSADIVVDWVAVSQTAPGEIRYQVWNRSNGSHLGYRLDAFIVPFAMLDEGTETIHHASSLPWRVDTVLHDVDGDGTAEECLEFASAMSGGGIAVDTYVEWAAFTEAPQLTDRTVSHTFLDPSEVPWLHETDVLLPSAGYAPGDLDGDGVVSFTDAWTFMANYPTPSGATWEQGDLNGDGDVDSDDAAVLIANYPAGAPEALDRIARTIPEPCSLLVWLLGAGALACRRDRH